jgi:hypothetical protein
LFERDDFVSKEICPAVEYAMKNDTANKDRRILSDFAENRGWTNESSLPDAPLPSIAIVSAHRRKERSRPGAGE